METRRMPTDDARRPRVLYVEDDPVLRWLGVEILGFADYEVLDAGSVREAIDVLLDNEVDAAVLDRQLPDGDGLMLVGHPALAQARILVLTVRAEEEDFRRAYEMGAHDYHVKPFDPNCLLAAIDRLLSASPDELEHNRRREIERANLIGSVEKVLEEAV